MCPQGLCLDSTAYLSNAMSGGPVMVLTSSCGDSLPPHSQSPHVTFARQHTGKDGGFPASPAFPVRPLFQPGVDPYSTLSSPLLSLQHPLFSSHALGRSYLNAAASGAFRPLGGLVDDPRPFHGSAFVPAKCMKLDSSSSPGSSSLMPSCFGGSESGSLMQSPGPQGGSSFLDGKGDDGRGDSDSGPERMSETPNMSEESRSVERSTPEDRGTPKRKLMLSLLVFVLSLNFVPLSLRKLFYFAI